MLKTMLKKIGVTVATTAILLGSAALPTFAQGNNQNGTQLYKVNLSAMNNSGVHSKAFLSLTGDQLNVKLYATGLEDGKEHLQHIHGKVDGSMAVCPAASADTDSDGTVDLAEGLPFYGPILESLTPFPTTMTEVYNQTFTVNTSDPTKNVLPLENREIVLHGKTVVAGEDKTFNNGGAGYDVTLPIACGHINRIGGFGMGNGNGMGQGSNGSSIGIIGNGAGSQNRVNIQSSNNVRVSQSNDSRITNDVNSNTNTGNNRSSFNTGGFTFLQSGDAMSSIMIRNSGNTNILSH